MDTPHFWSAAQALAFLTHKALAKLSNLFHAIENRGALDALGCATRRTRQAAAALARGDNIAARVSQAWARRPSEDRTNDVLEAFDESTGPFSPRRPRGNSHTIAGWQRASAHHHAGDLPDGAGRRGRGPAAHDAAAAPRDAPLAVGAVERPAPHVRPRLSPRTFDEPSSPPSPPTPTARGRSPLPTSPPPARPSAWSRPGRRPRRRRGAAAAAPRAVRRAPRRARRRRCHEPRALPPPRRRRGAARPARGPGAAPRTAAVAAAVAAADDSVLEEARDDPWWEGASPPGLAMRRKHDADDEARNDDGAADSSSDSDDDDDAASDGGSSSDYSGDEAERRPRRLGFAGSGGSLSTLVDDEEAAPLVTETDSPGDGDDDTASP